jgi:hypothetical protein
MAGRDLGGDKMRKGLWIGIGVVVLLLLIFGGALDTLYTDMLWFREVGYISVFRTQIVSQIELGLLGFVVFFLIVYSNLWLARHYAPSLAARYDVNPLRSKIGNVAQRGLGILIFLAAVVVSVLVALETSSHWMSYLMFTHASTFGKVDPVFGKDIGFYIFRLGFLQYIYGWLFFALIVAALATAVVHYIDRAIDLIAGVPTFAPHVKAHLSLLFAAVLFVKAWGYKLDMYSLLYSAEGKVYGAGFTDIHARLMALNVLCPVAIIAGILALINIKRRGIKLPAAALIILLATSLLVGVVYPLVVQQIYVQPNEIARESQYIGYNIDATRAAFNLDKVSVKNFPAENSLTAGDLQKNQATINSIRLWDYRPLQSTYNSLQSLGLYYDIKNVDVDRYTVKDQLREVMMAARELSLDKLSGGADTWVNRHFQYTHGYGAVMSPVNESTPDGSPEFFVSDIPPVSTQGIDITRPQIYFGELSNDYAIVDSATREFDHPQEGGSEYTRYAGKGGISIGNYFRRLAFAWRFADTNLLLNNPITTDSRIMFRRLITDRVNTIFPFLTYDRDPYLIISQGKLYWIQDAYTTSSMYPYSTPMDWTEDVSLNYVRNSVKVVIDAYDGTVNYYVADSTDPLLKTYAKIFPGVFKPMNAMPEDLQKHIRYPEDLFRAQSKVMLQYHVRDPQVFYTGSDRWEVAKEMTGTSNEQTEMDPYYVVMALPGEASEEFLLMRPFTPANKVNMVSWMAARCDPENYGKLVLYLFPTQNLVYGPSQIESRIDQDPSISSELTLWNQQGSSVNRGNLIVIPIDKSVLYIKPLYLQSTANGIPQLKRVIVAYADKLEMADTLDAALKAIFGGTSEAAPSQAVSAAPTAAPRPGKPGRPISPNTQRLIDQANTEFNQAEEALKKSDWATYGNHQKQLRQTLRQLQQSSGK